MEMYESFYSIPALISTPIGNDGKVEFGIYTALDGDIHVYFKYWQPNIEDFMKDNSFEIEVEFCSTAGGGGTSQKTRDALYLLKSMMEGKPGFKIEKSALPIEDMTFRGGEMHPDSKLGVIKNNDGTVDICMVGLTKFPIYYPDEMMGVKIKLIPDYFNVDLKSTNQITVSSEIITGVLNLQQAMALDNKIGR